MNKLLIFPILFTPLYLVRFELLGLPTNLWEVLVFGIVLAWFLCKKESLQIDFFRKNKGISFLIALLLIGVLLSILNSDNVLNGLGILKGWFVIPMAYSLLCFSVFRSRNELENIFLVIYWGVFFVAIISLVYYLMDILTYDGRLRAFYLSPNQLAMFLFPSVFLGIYFGIKTSNKKVIWFLSVFFVILAIYLTKSYAVWSSLLVGFLSIIWLNRNNKKRTYLFLVVFVFMSFFFLESNSKKLIDMISFESRSSAQSRIIIWKSAIKIIEDNLFLGIGPGNFQHKYLEYQRYFPPYLEWAVPQPHNLYLAFWLQAGLLGLIAFILLMTVWFRKVMVVIREQKEILGVFMMGIMLSFLFLGIWDTPYWKNDLAIMFWLIFIFSLGLKKSA